MTPANGTILLVSPAGTGGIQTWSVLLAGELQKRGRDVRVLFEDDGRHPLSGRNPEAPGVRTETLAYSRYDNKARVCRRIERILERDVDWVYPNTSALCYRAIAGMGARRPVAIAGCHGDNEYDYGIISKFAAHVDCIFGISSWIARVLRSRIADSSVPITVAHYGLPVREGSWSPKTRGRLCIAFVGRFVSCKRLCDVLEVGRLLKEAGVDFRLVLAGDGPARAEVESFVRLHHMDNQVKLLGFVGSSEVQALLAEAHLLLLLSSSEGFGLVALEAMRQGVVPIVTDICGCTDFIEHGQNGFIVQVGKVTDVARTILSAARNRDALDQQSRQAYRRAAERFTTDIMASRHLEIMAEAAEHHARNAASTPKWTYDFPGYLDRPMVPNWLSRGIRRLRYRHQRGRTNE